MTMNADLPGLLGWCEACRLGNHWFHDLSLHDLGCQNTDCECPVRGREKVASFAQENARRARLYDSLWRLAYLNGGVRIFVGGGHDTIDHLWVTTPREGVPSSIEGTEAIEHFLASWEAPDSDDCEARS